MVTTLEKIQLIDVLNNTIAQFTYLHNDSRSEDNAKFVDYLKSKIKQLADSIDP